MIVPRSYCPSLRSLTKFLSTLDNSPVDKLPIFPITNSLTIVASLDNLINEVLFSQFPDDGSTFTSKSSRHFSCVVTNETVMSNSLATRIRAGLFFIPERSVNGNGIKTMSPLIIYIFL